MGTYINQSSPQQACNFAEFCLRSLTYYEPLVCHARCLENWAMWAWTCRTSCQRWFSSSVTGCPGCAVGVSPVDEELSPVLSRLTQRGGTFHGGTHDFRTLPFSIQILPPAIFVHCTFYIPCLYFTAQIRRGKSSEFSEDTYFGEPSALVTCLFDVTAIASTLKAVTSDRD